MESHACDPRPRPDAPVTVGLWVVLKPDRNIESRAGKGESILSENSIVNFSPSIHWSDPQKTFLRKKENNSKRVVVVVVTTKNKIIPKPK